MYLPNFLKGFYSRINCTPFSVLTVWNFQDLFKSVVEIIAVTVANPIGFESFDTEFDAETMLHKTLFVGLR